MDEPAKCVNTMQALTTTPELEVIMADSNSTPEVRLCPKCGTSDRYADGHCKECKRLSSIGRYASDPKKYAAIKNSWRESNPQANKEIKARHYKKHACKVKAKSAAYRAENPVSTKEAIAAWNKANPDARRIYEQNRRSRKESSGGKLSSNISEKLFKLQKGKCACCKLPLGNDYHLDHIMPLALGGSNTDDNMQLLRQRCNNQKCARHPIDFMQSRGFLL